jgi:hypothetical protein
VIETVAAFNFEWNLPYGNLDYVVFKDQLYRCVSSRGLCAYFAPDSIEDWASTSTETFQLDSKFGAVPFGDSCPWALVADKGYG